MSTYILIHGAWHGAWCWDKVISLLKKEGHAAVALDLPGHGDDKTPIAEVTLQAYADRVCEVTSAQSEPVILVGHSLGGNLVLNYALRRHHRLRGLVAVNPWLDLAFRLPRWRMLALRLGAALRPDAPLSARRKPGVGTQSETNADPLVHHTITPRVFYASKEAATWALTNAASLTTPLLIIHGSDDRSTSAQASELFAQRAQGDITFIPWDGLGHNIHGDDVERPLFRYVASWMALRVG